MTREAAAGVERVRRHVGDIRVEAHDLGVELAGGKGAGADERVGDATPACGGVDGQQVPARHGLLGASLPAGAAEAGAVPGGAAVAHVGALVHRHRAEKGGVVSGPAVAHRARLECAPVRASSQELARHADGRPDVLDPAGRPGFGVHAAVELVELLGPEARDRDAADGEVAGHLGFAEPMAAVVSRHAGEQLARHGGRRHLGKVVVDAGLHDLDRAGDGGDDPVGLLGKDLVKLADHDGDGTRDARERRGVDLRVVDHQLQELGDAGGLGGGGHGRAVLELGALVALLGPAPVLGGGEGHPVSVLLRQARGCEVGPERREGEHVRAPVAGEEKTQDAAVGEAEHVDLRHAQARADLDGVVGHELVGERGGASRGGALGAGVHGYDGAAACAHGVDDGAEDAVLLAVAVEHEHGRHREVDAVGRAGLVRHARGCICPGNDGGAVRHRALDARRERRLRQRVGSWDVYGRELDRHGGSPSSGWRASPSY